MKYNNEKTIKDIKILLSIIESDAAMLNKIIRLKASTEELGTYYRACELMEDYIERTKILIGKMLDEHEDMEAENEGE